MIWGKQLPMVFQAERNECGLACLVMVGSYYGDCLSLGSLREAIGARASGVSVKELIDAADRIGLSCRPLRLELSEFKQLSLPVILHWGLGSFRRT